jgi:hypothetical protein
VIFQISQHLNNCLLLLTAIVPQRMLGVDECGSEPRSSSIGWGGARRRPWGQAGHVTAARGGAAGLQLIRSAPSRPGSRSPPQAKHYFHDTAARTEERSVRRSLLTVALKNLFSSRAMTARSILELVSQGITDWECGGCVEI